MKNIEIKELRIAIDGGAGTGKSSISKTLADKLKIQYISTGKLYRLITYYFFTKNDQDDIENIDSTLKYLRNKSMFLNGDIYFDNKLIDDSILNSNLVRKNINKITHIKSVRDFCNDELTRIAKTKGIVMDGRDITSVIMTDADFKFYIDVSSSERANRRVSQLSSMGIETNYDEIHADIKARDISDKDRKIAPLVKLDDAILIKNEGYSLEEIVNKMIKIIKDNIHLAPINSTQVKEVEDEK